MKSKLTPFIPLFILFALICFVYFTNLHDEFTIENLIAKQQLLIGFTSRHPIYFQLLYMIVYILSVWLIIPDSTILTLIAGMIFPLPLALFYSALGETIGAILFYETFIKVFEHTAPQNELSLLQKLRVQFNNAPKGYLLFLRVSHILPFWVVSLAAAYFKVPFWIFTWTTFVGTLPFCYVFANGGHSLTRLFATNPFPTVSDIFTPGIKISLLALGLFALFPLVYQKVKGKLR